MSKFLIHACKDRLWYVKQYLIKSMKRQGISAKNIDIYLDRDEEGCLESCMKSFAMMPFNEYDTWHMQDDVIICSDFKERTDMLDRLQKNSVVCGYCYTLDENKHVVGHVKAKQMWYSFPCIRIPNNIARYCADWYYRKVQKDNAYGIYIRSKRHDDTLFHIFMEDYFSQHDVLNLKPNLVDHVDYLIGGSVVNKARAEKETHAVHFEDVNLVTKLEREFTYVR